jgi:methylthioribose-1-phosphate isomerase
MQLPDPRDDAFHLGSIRAAGKCRQAQRLAGDEVRRIGDRVTAPETSPVFNPAFDVTPAALITAIITERGIFRPPYRFSDAR